jgi:choline dehydrogenase-like flavoprotein
MLVEAKALGHEAHFDYCIVGAGPAGISLALELEATGRRIALLEGGEETLTADSQTLYEGSVVGDPYFPLNASRLRFLGGTSNHWGGWCRELDAVDFLPKPYCAETGWPIRKADLDPYASAACRILSLTKPQPNRPLPDSGLEEFDIFVSPVKSFGRHFRERLVDSRNIHVVLKANVMAFSTDGAAVTAVELVDYAGHRGKVRASAYVLAAGGIENSRLLLWSNVRSNGQLIRHDRTLGKYWTEHPIFTLGDGFLAGEGALEMKENETGLKVLFLAPRVDAMLHNEVLACGLRVWRNAYPDKTRRMIASVACVAPKVGKWAVSLMDKRLVCGMRIDAAWEQQPLERNRIELSGELDRLGMPKVALHWRKSELDRQTALAAMKLLGEYCAQKNLGRVRIDEWLLEGAGYPPGDELAGYHHMGGTRMAATPEQGIVDRDCKVFDQKNLYVAGSSVFPTGGHGNPTYTIVQLAVRLAEHLKAVA